VREAGPLAPNVPGDLGAIDGHAQARREMDRLAESAHSETDSAMATPPGGPRFGASFRTSRPRAPLHARGTMDVRSVSARACRRRGSIERARLGTLEFAMNHRPSCKVLLALALGFALAAYGTDDKCPLEPETIDGKNDEDGYPG
jgi:hypothetical protein